MLIYLLSLLDDPGDEPLCTEIYLRYEDTVHTVTWRILHNRQDAEDAAMATWERVIKNFSTAKERLDKSHAILEAWLIVIAQNVSKDELRKRKRAPEPLEEWDAPTPASTEAHSTSEMVNDLIQLMPDSIRTVLEQRIFCEYSFKEMGKALGCREDAAQRRYSRALEALRERAQAEGFEC